MPIQFPVDRKTIVLCDFDMGGFRPPEMVKRRPAVVLVGRLPNRSNLATIVPLSGTPAAAGCDYQCEITLEQRLPAPFDGQLEWWVKAGWVLMEPKSIEKRGRALARGSDFRFFANPSRPKADMIATVSHARLDLLRTGRDDAGKRKYTMPKVTEAQFEQIRATILRALRFVR